MWAEIVTNELVHLFTFFFHLIAVATQSFEISESVNLCHSVQIHVHVDSEDSEEY